MNPIPTQDQNPHGLNLRYRVTKEDGTSDPDAVYFVLRLDRKGDDRVWTEACRAAVRHLALALHSRNHLPRVATDIHRLLEVLESGDSQVESALVTIAKLRQAIIKATKGGFHSRDDHNCELCEVLRETRG